MSGQQNDNRLLTDDTRAAVKALVHAANELLAADKACGKLDLDDAMLDALYVKHTLPVKMRCVEIIDYFDED